MYLVIVESPTKSNTIQQFLGPDYNVLSSYGHIRDLPKGELGIDTERNFEPKYVIPRKARKTVNGLKKEAQKASSVILATDEDREGEAIAWHLTCALDLTDKIPYQRITFHEITKPAIENALKNPRGIDLDLVDAQQARRTLDRIVGYKLSPFLWKKIARGLSAGRVQSVAVRFVVDREREIENFNAEEYWSIEGLFKKNGGQNTQTDFKAFLAKKDGGSIPKIGIKTKKEAEEIINELKEAKYEILSVNEKEIKRNPLPPFITSTLQQEAWKKFHFSAKMTMRTAQRLYETGHITYHRTDSLNLSSQSLNDAEKIIRENYGEKYHTGSPKRYKTKSKGAQEAHEAIRPSHPQKTPDDLKVKEKKLDESQIKLYDLIWRRFIASQMAQGIFYSTTVEIEGQHSKPDFGAQKKKSQYIFRASGQVLKFDGFLKVYPIKYEECKLPPLEKNERLELLKISPIQHFTQPPARYTEAGLIKILEENGIGRPSTYAPILTTIQERNYIEKNDAKRFQPTEIGIVVNDLLVKHFPKIMDANFTAEMEKNLDEIAAGQKKRVPIIKEFFEPFEQTLTEKYEEVSKKEFTEQPTEKTCPKCKSPLIIRLGKFGKFYACSGFPNCRHTESLEKNTLGIKCPKCKNGKILGKRTKKGKIFYGCSNWPKCDFALWDKPINETCPECGELLIETKKNQIKCSNKECDYVKKYDANAKE